VPQAPALPQPGGDDVTDPFEAQTAALGAFIRSQRELARLSLRQLAELTSVSAETLLTQAGLLSGQDAAEADGGRITEQVTALIRADQRLTESQKAALLAVYDSMLRE
jgi:hypothetical protein